MAVIVAKMRAESKAAIVGGLAVARAYLFRFYLIGDYCPERHRSSLSKAIHRLCPLYLVRITYCYPNGRMKAARDAMNKTVVSQFEIRSS